MDWVERMGFFSLIVGSFLIAGEPTPVKDLPEDQCITALSPDQKMRKPGEVEDVLRALALMRSQSGELIFSQISPNLRSEIEKYFSRPEGQISRLEQFYALLYVIGRELGDNADDLILDVPSAQIVLRASHVFPTPEFIDSLIEAKVDFHRRRNRATWGIKLSQPEMQIPLNDGFGYFVYQHGLCQKVQAVYLYGGFEAEITRNADKNIVVKFKEPIDFEGSFGSRGIVDIDLNFASLYNIEFLHGTKIGNARVKIADREFERNDHSPLLRWASSLLSQQVAPKIDW